MHKRFRKAIDDWEFFVISLFEIHDVYYCKSCRESIEITYLGWKLMAQLDNSKKEAVLPQRKKGHLIIIGKFTQKN